MTETPLPSPPPLKALPENWTRAIAVAAHPDDIEYGAAAAIARWTGQGKQIAYIMVTSGEAGIDGMHPDDTRRVREAEEIESARIVGVEEVDFLGFPDGVIEYGLRLRAAIAHAVRQHRPEIVITGNFRDSFGPGALNQADHIAVGRAVLDGVRDAGNRWVFTDQLSTVSSRGVASRRSGRRAPPRPATQSTPRRPSTRGSPHSRRTRRTSTASAGRAGTPRSSSRGSAAWRAPGSVRRSRRRSRSTR